MRNLAVLITVHNRCEKTISCLRNLFSQQLPDGYQVEVYMTDDGCTDGTPEAVREQFPLVNIIHGDGNLYWNRGMWTAWKAASNTKDYDFYLWLNDDTNLFNNSISCLLSNSELKSNKAIIVGATIDENTKLATYGGRIENFQIPSLNGQLHKIDYFNGNIVLIPEYVYKRIGMLDPFFIHSKGDFDYGMSAKENGIELYQVGKAMGICSLHPRLDSWCNPAIPLQKRWKAMLSPLGMIPSEQFYLERKHGHILAAFFHYCTIYIRCIFPSLWTLTGKARIG